MVYGQFQHKRKYTEAGFDIVRTTDTPANTIISAGGLVGVTTDFTPAGKQLWVAEQGTFELTDESYSTLTFAMGDTVNVSVTGDIGKIVQASGSGTKILGHAVAIKAPGTNTVSVRLATGRN